MKICMLNTVPGSVDGFRVTTYAAGVEYDLGATVGEHALAQVFIAAGLAEDVGAATASTPDDPQAKGDASPASAADAGETTTPAKPGRKPKAQ